LIDCEEQQGENEQEANLMVGLDDVVVGGGVGGVVGAGVGTGVGTGVGAGVGGIVDSLDDWKDPGIALATVAERRVSCP